MLTKLGVLPNHKIGTLKEQAIQFGNFQRIAQLHGLKSFAASYTYSIGNSAANENIEIAVFIQWQS